MLAIDGFFVPLQRHGPPASHYLIKFREELLGLTDRNAAQHALGDLYHEDNTAHGGPYLNRPPEQCKSIDADIAPIVYTLAPAAYKALGGLRYTYAEQADKGWFHHQKATAAITASLELTAMKSGTKFGDQESIFTHKLCPSATLQLPRPLELRIREKKEYTKKGQQKTVYETIIPDQFFKIDYTKNIKFFVLETDLATEDLETVYEKLRKWIEVLRRQVHRKQWGAPSLIVLIVTTDEYRLRKFMARLNLLLKDDHDDLIENFFFKFKPELLGGWQTIPIMYDLYEVPWERADGSTFDISRS